MGFDHIGVILMVAESESESESVLILLKAGQLVWSAMSAGAVVVCRPLPL